VLTELRETFYLPDYWFMIKGRTQEQPAGRAAQGKLWGRGVELSCPLQLPLSQHLHV